MTDVMTLLQFLMEGDLLGFLQAIYISAFQSVDLFYGVVIMLFTSALLIRTRSLILVSIIWILIGGFFMVAMPLLAALSLLLLILGIGGMLWQLFQMTR